MPALALALALTGGASLVAWIRLRRAVGRARTGAACAVAYERILPDRGPALLVLGDSLSVGVGAAQPEHSIAGRIGAACPRLTVVNRARSGARFADVPGQVRSAPSRRWDAVLLVAGGNDALARVPGEGLRRDVRRAVAAARELAPRVVVASCANLGGLPILPWPLGRVLERRSRLLSDVLAEACTGPDVSFVDFFRPVGMDPFSCDPARWFSADGVHPNSAAYGLCFAMLERRTGLAAALARRTPAAVVLPAGLVGPVRASGRP